MIRVIRWQSKGVKFVDAPAPGARWPPRPAARIAPGTEPRRRARDLRPGNLPLGLLSQAGSTPGPGPRPRRRHGLAEPRSAPAGFRLRRLTECGGSLSAAGGAGRNGCVRLLRAQCPRDSFGAVSVYPGAAPPSDSP